MERYTEPITIIDSHHGRYITAYALDWCLDNGWEANGAIDRMNLRRAIAADIEGDTEFTPVTGDPEDVADWIIDAIVEAEDWATDKFATEDYYFGSHPDLGDWGVWPINDEWPT